MIPYHDEPEASSHRMAESTKIGTLNEETLQSQNRQVLKQDAQLDLLSASIGRQHHLSLQMNEELDTQAALLDDVDNHLDGTQVRLQSASRRLDRFASSIREQGEGLTRLNVVQLTECLCRINMDDFWSDYRSYHAYRNLQIARLADDERC